MPEINMIESEMINRKGLMSYSKLKKFEFMKKKYHLF